jgi:hypothetical protein
VRQGVVNIIGLGPGRELHRPTWDGDAWGCHCTWYRTARDFTRIPDNPHGLTRLFHCHDDTDHEVRGAVWAQHWPAEAWNKEIMLKEINGLGLVVYTLPPYRDDARGLCYDPQADYAKWRAINIGAIREAFPRPRLHCSISYMIATAIIEGYQHLRTWGVVMRGTEREWEIERMNVQAWLGIARACGMAVESPLEDEEDYGYLRRAQAQLEFAAAQAKAQQRIVLPGQARGV